MYAGTHILRGSDGCLTRCGGVGRGSTGRRDGSGTRSWLLGLSGACRRAHRGGRWPTPLVGKVGGGMRREGGLSLVAGTPLLSLATTATAAGRASGTDSWAQASLRPSGEVINWAGQILEQKQSIYEARPSILIRSVMQQGGTFKQELIQRQGFPVQYDVKIKWYYCNYFSTVEIWLFGWKTRW